MSKDTRPSDIRSTPAEEVGNHKHSPYFADRVRFINTPAPFRQITDVREYRIGEILPGDRVIDIGANIGAFCIQAARITPHVVAVEPVTIDILKENLRVNGTALRVIQGALGDGSVREIKWDDRSVTIRTRRLGEIIQEAGGCDFLKCDCEGAEWDIDPDELKGIRHIEMELHQPPIGGPPNRDLLAAIGRLYHFEIERIPCYGPFGVMGILHAERKGGALR